MNAAKTTSVCGDPTAVLERHAVRRATGVPTVSLLVGPAGACVGTWRRWAARAGRNVVVAHRHPFPFAEWIGALAEQVDLSAAALRCLAERAGRDPSELLSAWPRKTQAERDSFCNNLPPQADDDLLRAVAELPFNSGPTAAAALGERGERVIPVIAGLGRPASWPAVLQVAGSTADFRSISQTGITWVTRLPDLPMGVAVPAGVWDEFCRTAPESRAKALLGEGEVVVPSLDRQTVEQTLADAGAVGTSAAVISASGADEALLESAVAAARATAAPPVTQREDDRARSAAERFLYNFLESLPETAGRFELNGDLEFAFGPRPAEVDLLCRSPRIAIELDGHFHFLGPDGYRRDRTKDWELQRRGFVVLRFLAEDVIPQLEIVRDRILLAFADTPPGANP
jgi:hypothetical protein